MGCKLKHATNVIGANRRTTKLEHAMCEHAAFSLPPQFLEVLSVRAAALTMLTQNSG